MKTITTQLDQRTHGLLTRTEAACVEFGTLSGPASIRNALARNGVTDVSRALDARLMPGHAHPAPRCDTTPIETDTDTGVPARSHGWLCWLGAIVVGLAFWSGLAWLVARALG